ncbi:hypothetical protein WJT86_06150 [Microvirga sp. W0021]|uniref:DNA methyltransferase n=1 Tax=Hohaiivirga grylli TaxID=3133970 RepID=A0ABV0BK44_9HYPH
MSATLINLVIQLLSGAAGGNALGNILKQFNLGPLGNTIAGALGGAGLGQMLPSILGSLASSGVDVGSVAANSGIDLGSLVSSVVGGGAGGAVLTLIAGAIAKALKQQ